MIFQVKKNKWQFLKQLLNEYILQDQIDKIRKEVPRQLMLDKAKSYDKVKAKMKYLKN